MVAGFCPIDIGQGQVRLFLVSIRIDVGSSSDKMSSRMFDVAFDSRQLQIYRSN